MQMNLSFITQNATVVAIIASVLSLVYAYLQTKKILKFPRGDKKMNEISDAIQEGAEAYMKRQYAVVAVIGLVIFAGMYYVFGLWTAVGFAIGAIFSSVAGIIGMNIAVRPNLLVPQAPTTALCAPFSLSFNVTA